MNDARELMERFQRAAAGIDPALSDVDVELLIDGAHQRRRRRVVRRVGLATASCALAALVLAYVVHPRAGTQAHGVAARSPAAASDIGAPALAPALRLADGSLVTHLDAGATLALVENSPARITVELRRGRERFDVVPRPPSERAFRVRAGAVTVTVVGTAFTVERIADRIGVAVEHGTVNVDWGQGARSLHTGESGWFPPLAVDGDGTVGAAGDSDQATRPRAPAATDGPPALGRQRPARPGSTSRVDALPPPSPSLPLGVTPPPAPMMAPTADQILRTADAARAAGHPAEAAALLRRLVADRPADPRAPLAAFTLGRLLLRDLGRAREAATAFAEARALAPDGPLAEDALVREAEALAQAGALDAAQTRARAYLRLYPEGRRAPAARELLRGGVE